MIKYTKEEFPARFTVFEHKCEYCGLKFFSNRAKTKYDTGTCRTYDNKRKRAINLPPVVDELKATIYDEKYFGLNDKAEAIQHVVDILGEQQQYVERFFSYLEESPNKYTRIWDKANSRYVDVNLNKIRFTIKAPINKIEGKYRGLELR